MNTVPSQGLRARGSTARHAGASTAIFLLWVVLIFTQISLSFAAAHHEDAGGRLFRSPPGKERFFETPTKTLFHAPSSTTSTTPSQVVANNGDLRETLYGDDKRIIHTGPNPLHN
ncbi:CLAVATA3/ESR (CLE)-related protein 16-like [Juglans microcarpa x Juglans regia]|uniref:CLAVATA3/ESR (CLE)-related protein 16-like n=1 Tax=Juglans microcarpa x Juglans regia TaxID=2249226 RepID=UPI001B7DA031|nr:CLAVATA3/ESR (CLE)-related protein 16-like [Juglans microcarpa x Juglans regia]